MGMGSTVHFLMKPLVRSHNCKFSDHDECISVELLFLPLSHCGSPLIGKNMNFSGSLQKTFTVILQGFFIEVEYEEGLKIY